MTRIPPNPSEPLVERVARAIYDAEHKGLRNCYTWDDEWEPHQECNRDRYLKGARAALAALPAAADDVVEALKWYARENNWRSCTVYMCGHGAINCNAMADKGNKARAALAKVKG